jgi:hypothetical protein
VTTDQFDGGRSHVRSAGDAADEEVENDPPFPHRILQFTRHGLRLLSRVSLGATISEGNHSRHEQNQGRAYTPQRSRNQIALRQLRFVAPRLRIVEKQVKHIKPAEDVRIP